MVSLARALSKLGVCSRREAERWVAAGRVSVAGEVVREPGLRVDPARAVVAVDGQRVTEGRRRVTVAFHKPAGCVTTRVDPGGRATIYDLLGGLGRWLAPVGRLDKDSAGLLILTNDTRLGQRLTAPEHEVPKAYHARVAGLPDEPALRVLREGVPLEDGPTRPAEVRLLGGDRQGGAWLEIVLREGRNRQVRRMCAAVGHDVLELVRVRIGALELGDLAPGEWRELKAAEIERLTARG
jgi:pseudouridine synthase